jgi:hypothetical protein
LSSGFFCLESKIWSAASWPAISTSTHTRLLLLLCLVRPATLLSELMSTGRRHCEVKGLPQNMADTCLLVPSAGLLSLAT